MYYDVTFNGTTNGTAATSTCSFIRIVTGTGFAASVRGYYVGARSGTAGGGQSRLITAGTAQSSSGSSFTPNKRDPNFPAATSCALTGTTCSQTTNVRAAVGFAQTGGMGGWVAIEPDAAIYLLAGGGANGNIETGTFANAASINVDVTMEFCEI